jgi:hypothetical protein
MTSNFAPSVVASASVAAVEPSTEPASVPASASELALALVSVALVALTLALALPLALANPSSGARVVQDSASANVPVSFVVAVLTRGS